MTDVADAADVAEVVVAFENPAAATEFARTRRVGEYAVAPLGFVATAVPTVPHPRTAASAGHVRPMAHATPTALAVTSQ
jgi:hypothetical protein